jgi:hypothetical protein
MHGRAQNLGIGVDGQRIGMRGSAGEGDEAPAAIRRGKARLAQRGAPPGVRAESQIWNRRVVTSSALYSAWAMPVPALIT